MNAANRFANGVFDYGCIATDVTPEVTDVKISALLPVMHLLISCYYLIQKVISHSMNVKINSWCCIRSKKK